MANRYPKPMLVWILTRVCVRNGLVEISVLTLITNICTAVGVMGDTRVYGYIVM